MNLGNSSDELYHSAMHMEHSHQHPESEKCFYLQCNGQTHDISNLLCKKRQYRHYEGECSSSSNRPQHRHSYAAPNSSSPCKPEIANRSKSWSAGCSLYPNLRAIEALEHECNSNCTVDSPPLREWMSDSDYRYTQRIPLPAEPQQITATYDQNSKEGKRRVSFSQEETVFEQPECSENPASSGYEDDDEDHPLLEIAPGMKVPYIGTAERTRALIKYSVKEQRTTMQTVCFSCQAGLICMAGMEFVACIACHTVSPLSPTQHPCDHDVPPPRGAGIGLLLEEAELLRRRAHNTDIY